MSRCLDCDAITKHMYEVTTRAEPGERLALICHECKESIAGSTADESERCGYAGSCEEPATYAARTSTTSTTDTGEVEVVSESEPLLCEKHFDELAG
ncbi:hypothetical protein ACLI4Z_01075 [Natrialbaceae archaeon A-arb3/5]